MPQLETMALWFGKKGEACAVIYHREKGSRRATLTWRGTWELELGRDVVESWKKVASDPCRLVVESERLQADLINSHGDCYPLFALARGGHPSSIALADPPGGYDREAGGNGLTCGSASLPKAESARFYEYGRVSKLRLEGPDVDKQNF
ncbi:hypothetical protein B0I37DRAFT_423010 [Chaetomium sp. MPI-CAGE-AT-0009]|nr:hypothetical protein B0I37DRAFT_423010 [Chaetomium sp. MPI-CAGE-AT-0009]